MFETINDGYEIYVGSYSITLMGYTKEELERPLIGVVSAHSEIVPGHFHLDKIADAVTDIPERCFADCKSLKEVDVHKNIKNVRFTNT